LWDMLDKGVRKGDIVVDVAIDEKWGYPGAPGRRSGDGVWRVVIQRANY
ncbi:unnamed protein product, partial [marine sediment metagenome]